MYINTQLTFDELQDLLNKREKKLIIKFTANWCAPCKRVTPLIYNLFDKLPNNILCYDIDIDKYPELFLKLKSKKMTKTIPALLYYDTQKERDFWFIADINISSSDEEKILDFFNKVLI